MDDRQSNLRMFIIDVLRHGGGAHFDGLVARLNNDSCIGWRTEWGRVFTDEEVLLAVRGMIVAGDVKLESMWDGRGVLDSNAALSADWTDEVLISNSDSALVEWNQWKPPVKD